MKRYIFSLLCAASLSLVAGCGDNGELGPADLSRLNAVDMAGTGDMTATGCAQPSDTCVNNPTTHNDIINGCVAGDVVKVDITPYYPAHGYENCALPTR